MDEKSAISRREAIVLHPFTDQKNTFNGDQIYSVTEKGIVIAVATSRMFYPWHRVTLFTYHSQDMQARKVIQGF